MTIQEAIKSGKPFARRVDRTYTKWDRWWMVMGALINAEDDPNIRKHFNVSDILATDWEIKP